MNPVADEAVKRNKARFCVLWKSGASIVFLLGPAGCPPKGTDDKGVLPSLSMATWSRTGILVQEVAEDRSRLAAL